jgi:DNA-directed RNA polymerase subunit RPC12/RpoP
VEWWGASMSEFKFACPVCGQHITAATNASGTQLECPTCFQKIIVPQAPSSPDSKFILSASQANKPRPPTELPSDPQPTQVSPLKSILPGMIVLLVLAAIAGAAFHWRDKILKAVNRQRPGPANGGTNLQTVAPKTIYPIPTNVSWTMDVTNAPIPEQTVCGSIHGSGFMCERATLQGGMLTLRQGAKWPPDLGLSVVLFAQQGEELSGKTVVVAPDRQPPLPRVVMRWKNEQDKAVSPTITSGYALKVIFGQPANNRMPGKLYIAFPDDQRSFAAGTFDAEIRKPNPPKAGQRK